ncbi:hypothetical protein SUGI_0105960 [Cryptomeria japonica]|nr:hypothetical protein SUGI_0105960 [Cryptomeria japonica]
MKYDLRSSVTLFFIFGIRGVVILAAFLGSMKMACCKSKLLVIVLLVASQLCIQNDRALGIRDINNVRQWQSARHEYQQLFNELQSKNHKENSPPASSSVDRNFYDSKRRVPNCPDPLHNR